MLVSKLSKHLGRGGLLLKILAFGFIRHENMAGSDFAAASTEIVREHVFKHLENDEAEEHPDLDGSD